MTRRFASCLAALFVMTAAPSAFAQQETLPEDVPLRENFSPTQMTIVGAGFAGAVFFQFFGSDVFGHPSPGMGPPAEDSVDWRYTHHVNPNPDPSKKWLGGVPDLGGYFLPAGAMSFYLTGTIGAGVSDDFFLSTRKHELMAFTGAFSWSMVTVNALKLIVGRTRPFAVREDVDPDAFGEDEKEQYISFPSGHSASAAATMTFLALDLSDELFHGALADASPAVRYGVGRALPIITGAGVTWMVMYSRIRDQKHWLSDTLTGAMIGAGFSALFYSRHFDHEGNPRRNFPSREGAAGIIDAASTGRLYLQPTPNGPMGLGYGFEF